MPSVKNTCVLKYKKFQNHKEALQRFHEVSVHGGLSRKDGLFPTCTLKLNDFIKHRAEKRPIFHIKQQR